jgi:hypothetical protein
MDCRVKPGNDDELRADRTKKSGTLVPLFLLSRAVRHSEEQCDEAIQFLPRGFWIASLRSQ